MAKRRMFSQEITDSDEFLDMPSTTQNLYFHLGMKADDDGFVNNPKTIMRNVRAMEDDLKILIAKKFIIPFESGIIVIRHWRVHNYIQKDRYTPTRHKAEKSQITVDESHVYNLDTECIQVGYTGKISLVKSSEEKSISHNPTLDEIITFAKERDLNLDLTKRFFDYYEVANWHDPNGKPIKNWKQLFLVWVKNEPQPEEKEEEFEYPKMGVRL